MPEEAVILAETVEELFRGLDPEDRSIVELQLQGFSSTESATILKRSERTVRRVRARVRNRIGKMLGLSALGEEAESSSENPE